MKKNRTCLFAIAGIVLSSVLVLGCPSQDTKETTETQTTASDVTVPESVNKSEYTAPSEKNKEAVIKDLKTAFTTSGKTLFPDFSGAVAEDTSRTTVKEMTTMFEEQFAQFRSDLQYGKAELDINKAPGNIEELPDGVSAVIPELKLYLNSELIIPTAETEMSGMKASANACASGKLSVDYTKLDPKTKTEFKSAVFNASGSLNGDIQANMVTEGETTSTSLNLASGNLSMAAKAGSGMVFVLDSKVAGKIVVNVSYAVSADTDAMQVVADKAAAGKMGSLTKEQLGALVSAAKIKVDVYTLDDQFAFNWVELDGFDEVYDFIEKSKAVLFPPETPEVTE
ncbi:hypothetical protein [uncultured Treponema sp.]|uniref:hypothetical protein n=1 Tax=uncultured Treponema sp. TaxID=162155 RepID=UPI002591B83D|nr:hypothetical protein [uncultured Treponema sp.]